MTQLTNKQKTIDTTNISHNTIQYVDDSTNIISCTNTNDLQTYIDIFFSILEGYYNSNKLLINSDKSKLLLITKPTLRQQCNHIKLHTSQYIIEQSHKIKILGIYITSGFNNIATINNIISKVNYRSNVLKGIFKYSSQRTKTILTNSIIISVIRYAAPILINTNNSLILNSRY